MHAGAGVAQRHAGERAAASAWARFQRRAARCGRASSIGWIAALPGAMVVARNDAAHRALAEQFRARTVHKMYIALLHGRMARDAGTHRAADFARSAAPHAHDRAAAHGPRSAHRLARAAAPGQLHAGCRRAAHRPHPPDSRAFRGHRPSLGGRHALRRAASGRAPARDPAPAARSAFSCTPRGCSLRIRARGAAGRSARAAGSRHCAPIWRELASCGRD